MCNSESGIDVESDYIAFQLTHHISIAITHAFRVVSHVILHSNLSLWGDGRRGIRQFQSTFHCEALKEERFGGVHEGEILIIS